jgi:hypothetical protein
MTPRTVLTLLVTATWLGTAAPARATHANPGSKSKKITADLVVAYEACAAPDTTTDGSGFAACSTIVRSDPSCGYGPSGKGKLKITSSTSRAQVKVGFKLTGLDAGCEGSVMGVLFHWRVTGDLCSGASCTVDETSYMPGYGACTVTAGACTLSATSDLPALPADGRTGVELIGAEIVRDGTITSFRPGFFSP